MTAYSFMRRASRCLPWLGLACLALTFPAERAQATELVFHFTSPSFGGDPLNGSFLLESALAQRSTEKTDLFRGFSGLSASDSFKSELEGRVLDAVAKKVMGDTTGDTSGGSGTTPKVGDKETITFGIYSVDVSYLREGIHVEIKNTMSGQVTAMDLPWSI